MEKIQCKVCSKELKNNIALGLHIKIHNLNSKQYYDLFYKKDINEGFCKTCNAKTSFVSFTKGYLSYCTNKCAQINNETRLKCKQTCLAKYNVENVFQDKNVQEKIKQQNIKHLGVEYPQQSVIVRTKSKKTRLNKYGNENYNNREKAKQTCLQKYNKISYSKTSEFKEKVKKVNNFNDISVKGISTKNKKISILLNNGYIPIQDVFKQFGQSWYKNKIVDIIYKHGTGFITNESLIIVKNYYEYKNNRSSQIEYKVYQLLHSMYKNKIILGETNLIKPFEVDFYLPDLNIAIEFNGMYWHSINFKHKYYHFNKSILCLNKNIRLIHLYEYEDWNIIKNFLYNIINGIEEKYNNMYLDFNKFSPLSFPHSSVEFSGPFPLLYNIYGAGFFKLNY